MGKRKLNLFIPVSNQFKERSKHSARVYAPQESFRTDRIFKFIVKRHKIFFHPFWFVNRLSLMSILMCGSLVTCFFLSSCSGDNNKDAVETKNTLHVPALPPAPRFNKDSAYQFIKQQVDFGPRVPGTAAHGKCADYLAGKLKSYGLEVQIQNANVTTYDGKKFNLKNIIGSYNPGNNNRILLLAHWDTRPWADNDSQNKDKPNDGADDGASGVAVILEIVRQLSIAKPDIGIDVLFDDLEDYGKENDINNSTWCLGTQYWAKNPHIPGYKAKYGILLDMVGSKNAAFPQEGYSLKFAPYLVKRIWNKAARLGYSGYFTFQDVPPITDDHFYINTIANIPCVDIINMNPLTGQFGSHHHRHTDNMDNIDKNTLDMVGQTVLEVLWEEQQSQLSQAY